MTNKIKKLGLSSAVFAALALTVSQAPARAQQGPAAPQPPDAAARSFFPEASGGWLGVGVEEVSPDKAKELKMASAYGVFVNEVGDNSPAAKAGLKKGDVITTYNGERVEGAAEFRRLVRETPPGHTADISVWRDARATKLSAEIGHAPEPPAGNDFFGRGPAAAPRDSGPRDFGRRDFNAGPQSPLLPRAQYGGREFADTPSLGVSAMDLSAQLGAYFGAPNNEGVLVTDVHKGSAGEKAGLKAGDVITKVDGQQVRNVGELRMRLRDARDAKSVALSVLRKGTEISVTAQPELPQPPQGPQGLDRRIPL